MKFNTFIKATDTYCDLDAKVPAPILRKSFTLDFVPQESQLYICVSGLYELYINGEKITRGYLCPYFNNPDHILYYDVYQISRLLSKGHNAVAVILGNGFANQDTTAHNFDKAPFRAPLVMAMYIDAKGENKTFHLEADESFKVHSSPILYDMYRHGVIYDARAEIEGFANADFDDSQWERAKIVAPPKGEIKFCRAKPITQQYVLNALSVEKQNDVYCFIDPKTNKPFTETYISQGWCYDFGYSRAGVCKLKIMGKRGQKVTIRHGEFLRDGKFNMNSIYTINDNNKQFFGVFQTDTYILKGGQQEIFIPMFTYHGFRYAFVEGITEQQATQDLLTFIVFNTDIKKHSDFSCSDTTLNKLYDMAIQADLSNFHHFPTDCPHREKNGWTGDASMSAHQLLLSFDCKENLATWLENIRYAQQDNGMLPGIVPTDSWGYAWGSGPVWDCVIVNLPYYIYKYSGSTDVFRENADMIFRYLKYVSSRRDENGLIAIGLGDWCQPYRGNRPDSPLVFIDSSQIYESALRCSLLFGKCQMMEEKAFCDTLAREMRCAIRKHLIDFDTFTVKGDCQTSQAVAIKMGLFDENELKPAYNKLLEIIRRDKYTLCCGMIGLRNLFHVLFDNNDADIALDLITKKDAPSYRSMIDMGGTALFESLVPNGLQESQNHHFYGDIINLFISKLAGLRINPDMDDCHSVLINPVIPDKTDSAYAEYQDGKDKISVSWKKSDNKLTINVNIAGDFHGKLDFDGKVYELCIGTNTFEFNP